MMKRSELVTVLAIALVVVIGGLLFLRPKHRADDQDQVSARSIPTPEAPPEAQPVPVQAVEPPAEKAELPIQKPEPEVAAQDRDSNSSGSRNAPSPESPAVYEPKAELAAGVLPQSLAGALSRGIIPNSQEILKAADMARRQEKTALGQSLEANIRDFLATQPEARILKYLVSCGAEVCEVQLEQTETGPVPPAKPEPSAVFLVAMRLEMQPWFQSALTLIGRNHFSKDGHSYFAGYWKVR